MRVRFRYRKEGKVRFTSHRDVARLWERALRRAGLPVALTEGFSPRPKVHFGLALSTGHESLGEYVDVDLRADDADMVDLPSLPSLLTPLFPVGIVVESVAEADRREDSLQQAVTACQWTIEVLDRTPAEVADQCRRLLEADHLPMTRERKGKAVVDDIRPYILALSTTGSVITAELATQPRGLRPAELLAAFEPPATEGRVCRTHQWISLDGQRREPLAAATP